jgi:hypothetical protein
MAGSRVRFKFNHNLVRDVEKIALRGALQDIGDDLSNMASQAAPIDKGILEGSYNVEMKNSSWTPSVRVTFSVQQGNFNYAQYVHDNHPIGGIGADTRAKPSASSGITGQTFPAGGNFLKGPLDLNKQGYRDYIEQKINAVL